jgi:hypothetical protein
VQHVDHREADQRDQGVVSAIVVQVQRAEPAALEAAQAAFAAGERSPAKGHREREGAQRQRQQREVHAAPAQHEEPDRHGEHRHERDVEQQRQQHLPAEPVLLRERRRVAADAEPGCVPEGDEPGRAHQQVQR